MEICLHVDGYENTWRLVWSPRTDIRVSNATAQTSTTATCVMNNGVLQNLATTDDDHAPATVLTSVGKHMLGDRCASDDQTLFIVMNADVFRFNGVWLTSETGAMVVMHDEAWVV